VCLRQLPGDGVVEQQHAPGELLVGGALACVVHRSAVLALAVVGPVGGSETYQVDARVLVKQGAHVLGDLTDHVGIADAELRVGLAAPPAVD